MHQLGAGPSPRVDAWVARGVLALSVGTMVLTSWIGFRSWGEVQRVVLHPLTLTQSQALVAGLWSSNLMVLQTLFMARVPWLERAWGRRTLAHRHRVLGYWSFWLMVLHVLLFTLQRWTHEADALGPAMLALFVTDSWMVWASIGTVLIVLVVVTSIAVAMRALRYETWHLVHLNAYLGMGLALPHQLVSVDFETRWTTAYWWVLFVGTLVVVVVFRVVVPVLRTRRHGIRVVGVEAMPGATRVTMAGRGLGELVARPGQYFVWRFLGSPGWTRGHPYSLSAAPAGDTLEVTVARGGDGGERVAALTEGTRVAVEGPFGSLGGGWRRHERATLFAAGIGITPLRALLDGDLDPAATTLVYRVSDRADLLFTDDLARWEEQGLRLVVLDGPRRSRFSWLPAGTEGFPVDAMGELVPDVVGSDVLVCGPGRWADGVVRTARALGVARRDVHREDFS